VRLRWSIYTKADWSKWAVEKYGKPQRRSYEGGVDVVVNLPGGDTWVPSLRCIKRGGKLLVLRCDRRPRPKEDLRYVWSFEIEIKGSNSFYDDNLSALMELIQQGKIKPVIDKVLPLEQAAEGLRLIQDREIFGKVVVTALSEQLTLEQIHEIVTRAPFHQWLGLKVVAVHDDGIEIKATWREEWVVNVDRRYTHGGILASLIDLGADWAMVRKLGRGVPTIDMRVDYHAAALPGDLTIKGKIVRMGSQFSTAEASIFDAQGKLLASGRGTYFTAPPAAAKGIIGIAMKKLSCILFVVLWSGIVFAQNNMDWAYPVTPKPEPLDSVQQKQVPGSTKKYTQAQIDDPFNPPDWFPDEHPSMPRSSPRWAKARGPCLRAMPSAVRRRPSGIGEPRGTTGELYHPPDGGIQERRAQRRPRDRDDRHGEGFVGCRGEGGGGLFRGAQADAWFQQGAGGGKSAGELCGPRRHALCAGRRRL